MPYKVRLRLLTALAVIGLSGCGWQKKVEFVSPQGSVRIRIYQPFPINEAGLKLVLLQDGHEFELLYRRADTFLQFADVWWAPDGASVAVYSCGIVEAAFDLRTHKPLAFSSVRSSMAQHIRAEYDLSKTRDVDAEAFSWACSARGHEAFLNHYPKARPF